MRISLKIFLCVIVEVIIGYANASTEFHASLDGMESLLHTEHTLLTDMKAYLNNVKLHIDAIEREMNNIEIEHEIAWGDPEYYLTNPINAYRLIKRLHYDWHSYEQHIRSNIIEDDSILDQIAEHRESLTFPNAEDVQGAAMSLVRLQRTYQLDVAEMADNSLNGIKYGQDTSWQDCFTLAQQLFELKQYNHTRLWLKESVQRLRQTEYFGDEVSLNYMETAAEYFYDMGDTKDALSISRQVLEIDAERSRALDVVNALTSNGDGYQPAPAQLLTTEDAYSYHHTEEFKTYEKLCRGEQQPPPTQLRPLKCFYLSVRSAFNVIAPQKIEEHSVDPLVWTIHNAITETKINAILDVAITRMQRSTVRTESAYASLVSEYRVSRHAWLEYDEHSFTKDMLRDLHSITGLNMTHCEQLQVANYIPGGHYEPHWDFYTKESQMDDGLGNRIATAIFYLSEVEQGGDTVFPFLGISVKPKKGDVLFWYNLHRSLDNDYRTKHAGCPVLKGSKWIANVWTRDLMQSFNRPCLLHRDNELSLPYEAPSD